MISSLYVYLFLNKFSIKHKKCRWPSGPVLYSSSISLATGSEYSSGGTLPLVSRDQVGHAGRLASMGQSLVGNIMLLRMTFTTTSGGRMAERSKALDSSSTSLITSGIQHSSEETLVGSNPTPINFFFVFFLFLFR